MIRSAVLSLFALTLIVPALRAEEGGEATKLAEKLTTEGAATYSTKNAKAMAAYYTEDATVTLYSKDKDTGQTKTDVKHGRDEIEAMYQDLFKNAGTIEAKNTVQLARMIDSNMLVIYGTFQPDVNDTLKVEFVQVRVKRDDKWLMTNVQLFLGPVEK
jgi:ketosteroid isomerase-like protein